MGSNSYSWSRTALLAAVFGDSNVNDDRLSLFSDEFVRDRGAEPTLGEEIPIGLDVGWVLDTTGGSEIF